MTDRVLARWGGPSRRSETVWEHGQQDRERARQSDSERVSTKEGEQPTPEFGERTAVENVDAPVDAWS